MKIPDNSPQMVGGALVVVLLYFLSPPFFVAAVGWPFLERHQREIEIAYAPAIWLSDHWPPYEAYIQHTIRLLGVAVP